MGGRDVEKNSLPSALGDAVRVAALDILYRQRIGIHDLQDVRKLILDGHPAKALTFLVGEYGLEWSDANAVMEYLDPAVKGKKLRFEEISPGEIVFPDDRNADIEEDEDPLKVGIKYFARRGLVVGEMITATTAVSCAAGFERSDKVYFDRELLDPWQLDQVWRVLPVDV